MGVLCFWSPTAMRNSGARSARRTARCGWHGERLGQRRGLLSERPLAGGSSRSHEGPSEEDPGAAPYFHRDRTRNALTTSREGRSPLEEDEPVEGPEAKDHFADDVADRDRAEGARVGRERAVVSHDEDLSVGNGEGVDDLRR